MSHANENPTGTKGHHEFVPPQAVEVTSRLQTILGAQAPKSIPLAQTGYVPKEYKYQEYPKHVGAEGKLANNAQEEKAILAAEAPKSEAAE